MDTVAAELMEWEELSLEDLEIPDRIAPAEERRVPDPLTERVPRQIQESAPGSEEAHRLRRTPIATPKEDPLRRITP